MVWNQLSMGWNPWAELSRMQSELDRLFAGADRAAATAEFPPIEVWSGEDGLKLHAELAGFDANDLEVSVVGDTLTLRGSRAGENASSGTWHRQERGSGRFVRTLQLPFAIEADAVKASMRNGILDLELPRAASEKPRKITVEAS